MEGEDVLTLRLRFGRNDPALVLRSVSAVVDAVLTETGATIDQLEHVRHGIVEIVDAMAVEGGARCVECSVDRSELHLRLHSAAHQVDIDEPARQIAAAVFRTVEIAGGTVGVMLDRTGWGADG